MIQTNFALAHILEADAGLKIYFFDNAATENAILSSEVITEIGATALASFDVGNITANSGGTAADVSYGANNIVIHPVGSPLGPCDFMVLTTNDDHLLAYEAFVSPVTFAGDVDSTIQFTNGYIFSLRTAI